MTPYEHVVAKAKELNFPIDEKPHAMEYIKTWLEDRNPNVPFMLFISDNRIAISTSDGQGFRDDGYSEMHYVISEFTEPHRGFLWNSGKLHEIQPENFRKVYFDWVHNKGPDWEVTVTSRHRPSPASSEVVLKKHYVIWWSRSHDSLHKYLLAYLNPSKQHTIEIVPAEVEAAR